LPPSRWAKHLKAILSLSLSLSLSLVMYTKKMRHLKHSNCVSCHQKLIDVVESWVVITFWSREFFIGEWLPVISEECTEYESVV